MESNDLEQRAVELLSLKDHARLMCEGGYPAAYEIENGKIYIATCVDREPILTVQPLAEFIAEAEDFFSEYTEYDFNQLKEQTGGL